MSILRAVILILAVVVFIHGYRGLVNGRVYVRGMYADKEKNPKFFWISIVLIFLSAVALFVMAFVAKIK